MMVNSREKGAKFERDVVSYLREHGYPGALRTRTPGYQADRGDVAHGPAFTLELKNQVQQNLTGWWKQVLKSSERTGLPPVLIHKKHGVSDPGEQWVTMSLSVFLDSLRPTLLDIEPLGEGAPGSPPTLQ